MTQINEFFKNVIKKVTDHKISVYAAQAALFVIMSALPFAMLIISLLKYLIPFDKADVIRFGSTFVPQALLPMLNNLLDEIYSGATVSVVSITTVAAVWAASKGMLSLIMGLESVYETEKSRGYIRRRLMAFVYTAVFICIIVGTLLFFVAGQYFINLISEYFPAISYAADLLYTFPVILYLFILTFIFAVLYKLLPGEKLSLLTQLPGAFFTAVGWIVFSAGYSFYVNRFTDYSYIYGSLTAVVLLMLWLYFCMNIFLLGAELNCLLKERKEKRIEG